MNNERLDAKADAERALTPTERTPLTEMQRRWLSWNVVSGDKRKATQQFGVKGSYAGTVDKDEVKKRRAANKVARKQRKVNRQNGSGK